MAYSDTIDTRWADNDIYGHVNNVTYYSFFDTVINRFLIRHGLDIHSGDTVAFIVSSECQYQRPIAYPETIRVALKVAKLGNSSVTYALTLFNQAGQEAATARMTHVFVNRDSQKPTPIPATLRDALAALQ